MCLVFILIICFGGKDLIELESRDFIIALGIDKNKKNNIELDILESDFGFFENKKLDNKNYIKTGIGKNFEDAFKKINNQAEKKIYLGHAQIIFIGKKLVQDNFLFKKLINDLAQKNFVNLKVKTMFVNDPKKILQTKFDSKYISFIKNKFHKKKFTLLNDLYERVNK